MGVALGAGIDAVRRRQAEKIEKRCGLIRAGNNLASATGKLLRIMRLAGAASQTPEWAAIIDAADADVQAVLTTINEAGSPELVKAAGDIMTAMQKAPEQDEPTRASTQLEAFAAYGNAVQAARL